MSQNIQWYNKLQTKWGEVPFNRMQRTHSSKLLALNDKLFLDLYKQNDEDGKSVRQWYRDKYTKSFTNKSVLDFGSGMGYDGVYFAKQGANMTFGDIISSNLEVIKKITNIKSINSNFYHIKDLYKFDFDRKFDVVMFLGSIHHVPIEVAKKEIEALKTFIKKGATIVMLSYPKERFELSGAANFKEFGVITDGKGTPYARWYDNESVKELFGSDFDLVWSKNFGTDDKEFNWFELTKMV